MAKTLGQFPYAFIPNFNSYGDKRKYIPGDGKPYCEGKLEAAILFVGPINQFWKMREPEVHLLGNKHILRAYNSIKKVARRMKKDEIALMENTSDEVERYSLVKDYYKGLIRIEGLLKETTLDEILDEFFEWNVIEWRIPTIYDGIYSQHLALENQFIVSGYDPGSYKDQKTLHDTLVMCKFPKPVDDFQFHGMRLTESAKSIVNLVFDQMSRKKSRQTAVVLPYQK